MKPKPPDRDKVPNAPEPRRPAPRGTVLPLPPRARSLVCVLSARPPPSRTCPRSSAHGCCHCWLALLLALFCMHATNRAPAALPAAGGHACMPLLPLAFPHPSALPHHRHCAHRRAPIAPGLLCSICTSTSLSSTTARWSLTRCRCVHAPSSPLCAPYALHQPVRPLARTAVCISRVCGRPRRHQAVATAAPAVVRHAKRNDPRPSTILQCYRRASFSSRSCACPR